MLAQSPEVKTGGQAAAVEQTKAQASTPFVASGPMGFLLAAMENGQNDN